MIKKPRGTKLREKPKNYAQKQKVKELSYEFKAPELSAEAIDGATVPFARLEAVAKECGFPERTLNALMRRMATKYKPVKDEVERIKTPQLLKLIEDKLQMALEHMDEYTFADANLRDLAVTFGILAEKRQLLKGEPTQILSINERSHMNELIPDLIKEAGRRGMTIDVTPVHVDDKAGIDTRLEPRSGISEMDVSKTARKFKKKPIEPNL